MSEELPNDDAPRYRNVREGEYEALLKAAKWLKKLVKITSKEMDNPLDKSIAIGNGFQAVLDLERIHRVKLD